MAKVCLGLGLSSLEIARMGPAKTVTLIFNNNNNTGNQRTQAMTFYGQQGEEQVQRAAAWPWPYLPMPQQKDMQVTRHFCIAFRRGTAQVGAHGSCDEQSQAGGSSVLALVCQGFWQVNLTYLAPADTGGFLL